MSCCFGEEEDPREKLRNAIKAGAIRVTVRQDTFQHVSHMDAGDSKPHPLGGVGSPLNLKALDTETYNHVRSLQEYAAGVLRNDTYPSTLPPAIPSQAHLSPSSGAGGAGRRSLSRDRGGEHHYTSSGSLTAASPLRETRYGRGSKDGSGSGGDSSSPTSTENGTESSLVNGNAGVYAMTSISKQNGSSYPHQHPGNEPSWDASTSTATGTTTLARMRHSVFPMEATGDAMLSVRALDALGTQSVTLGSFHAANAAELAPEERPLSPEQPDPVTSHVLPSTTTPARPISPSAESTITTTTTNNPYPLRSSSAAGSTSADLTRSPSILSGPSTYSSVAGSYASTMGAGGQATRQQQSGSAFPPPARRGSPGPGNADTFPRRSDPAASRAPPSSTPTSGTNNTYGTESLGRRLPSLTSLSSTTTSSTISAAPINPYTSGAGAGGGQRAVYSKPPAEFLADQPKRIAAPAVPVSPQLPRSPQMMPPPNSPTSSVSSYGSGFAGGRMEPPGRSPMLRPATAAPLPVRPAPGRPRPGGQGGGLWSQAASGGAGVGDMDTASVLSGSDGLPVSEERPLSPTAPPSISSLASLARRPIMPTAASPPPPVPVPTSPRGPQPTQDYFVPMKGVDDDSGGGGGVKRNASMKAEVESLAPTVLFRNMPAVTVHAGTNGTGRSFPAAAVKVNVNVAPGQAAAFVPWGN